MTSRTIDMLIGTTTGLCLLLAALAGAAFALVHVPAPALAVLFGMVGQ